MTEDDDDLPCEETKAEELRFDEGERTPRDPDPTSDDPTEEPTDDGTTETAADTGEATAIDLTVPPYYLNREKSELAFQRRVLYESLDEDNPLLERVKFLAILTRNLDEFFRKRVGRLRRQVDADGPGETVDGRTPREQWEHVLETGKTLLERQAACYRDTVWPALADAGIEILDREELDGEQRRRLREYFEQSVLPALTPLSFDPTHPFPFISNESLSLAVITRKDPDAPVTFSRVKIPPNRDRFVQLDSTSRFVLLEDIVRMNLDLLFPDVEIVGTSCFRVTRSAAVGSDEESAADRVELIEEVIEERRFARVVRLEIEPQTPATVLRVLTRELDVDGREVFVLDGPLDYRDLETLVELDRPGLKRPDWNPQPHPRLSPAGMETGGTIFDRIREEDVLVHHPYHSFDETVLRFFETAATDPQVIAIKAAIYRTANDSQVVETLIEAARNGTQVAVTVELAARFDEQNNLEWAKRLEEEGIHVSWGAAGYKIHAKTSLVVREEVSGVTLYSHVGTGNYHSETAKVYEDLGLLTANPDIGRDLVGLFNYFTGHSLPTAYRELLVAPKNMRERFVELIRAEATRAVSGNNARIVAKMNRLEDPRLVRELYEASIAGVEIDLIVRDICRLRPGIDGVSETIEVHSVVGRFLEHSRIFYFEAGGEGRYYIGSADWMTRNIDERVEVVAPVTDPRLESRLDRILQTLLDDDVNRWVMRSDGSYERCDRSPQVTGGTLDAHEAFMNVARADAAGLVETSYRSVLDASSDEDPTSDG